MDICSGKLRFRTKTLLNVLLHEAGGFWLLMKPTEGDGAHKTANDV